MKTAEILAKYMVKNWHSCPVPDSVTVENCCCWGGNLCAKCIVKHANDLDNDKKKG